MVEFTRDTRTHNNQAKMLFSGHKQTKWVGKKVTFFPFIPMFRDNLVVAIS